MDAALRLTCEGRSFDSLSLREVTREAGMVPTAFYRHFSDMNELGLALIDRVCLTLRRQMREARERMADATDMAIHRSVRTYLGYVRSNVAGFTFLSRIYASATPPLDEAIAREIRYFINELADDLRVIPRFREFPSDDVRMIASLIVHTVLTLTRDILALPEGESQRAAELEIRGIKQLRLILIGAAHWQPELGQVAVSKLG